jgi:inorganic pyrophosphatase
MAFHWMKRLRLSDHRKDSAMKEPGKLPPVDPETDELNVIIETPRGSHNKYAYDEQLGLIRFKKLLPAGMFFPFDFGFVPSTRSGDGDPLDVLVIADQPLFPGCLVRGRLLGALKGQQHHRGKWESNHRLVVIPLLEERTSEHRSFRDLGPKLVRELETFFIFSHELEKQKFRIVGRVGVAAARSLVREAALAYQKQRA